MVHSTWIHVYVYKIMCCSSLCPVGKSSSIGHVVTSGYEVRSSHVVSSGYGVRSSCVSHILFSGYGLMSCLIGNVTYKLIGLR